MFSDYFRQCCGSEKVKKIQVLKAGWSLLTDEDLSCSMDVLYGGLGKSKLQLSIKNIFFIFAANFFNFWS
jgi:hypothetical protein